MTDQLLLKRLRVGQMQTNCYIVADRKTDQAVIVDPGDDAEYIENVIRDLAVIPIQIIATHGHFDHIMAAFELQQAYQIPFVIHGQDEFLVQRMQETARFFLGIEVPEIPPEISSFMKTGDVIQVGRFGLTVIETPGHTPGSCCLYNAQSKLMLTGDTLFSGGAVGRTDFSYSSTEKLQLSLKIILAFPGEVQLFPGHEEETSILSERAYHLFDHNQEKVI